MENTLIRIANTDSRYKPGFHTMLTIGIAALFIYVGYGVNKLVATPDNFYNNPVILIMSLAVMVILVVGVVTDIKHYTIEAYKDRLSRLDKKTLIKYYQSPELNNDEQRLVLETLNKWYPGWSIEDN